ncbi:uncharacterized protein J3D65DRAFT_46371 [Phyllosticta citribraziliensis]|uniref:Rhodopsin domain-containing protein n=1 Tax=Phyllosticta citribraziliensis TaxID=989973 RepID=A0ABR1MAW4_9PEZI
MGATGVGQVASWYVCTAAAGTFLATRLVVRLLRMGGLAVDDYLLIGAFGLLVGDLGIQHRIWVIGMAEPQRASPAGFIEMQKLIYPGSLFYTLSLWLIKAALVIFYKRLAGTTYPYLQKLYNATLVWLAVSWLVILFDTIFRCYPLSRSWSREGNTCPPSAGQINYWITILFNILTDVLIMCLPISMVLKLNLPTKQKFGVSCVFALGIIVIITSIIRAYYSHTQETMITCTVSMIETSIAIIMTCLPTLRVVILGHTSRKGTYPSRRGSNLYELNVSGRQNCSHRTTITANGTKPDDKVKRMTGPITRSDSEDELVKELAIYGAQPVTPNGEGVQHNPEVMSSLKLNPGDRVSGETYVNAPRSPSNHNSRNDMAVEVTTEFQIVHSEDGLETERIATADSDTVPGRPPSWPAGRPPSWPEGPPTSWPAPH